jgi:hypothetical protein
MKEKFESSTYSTVMDDDGVNYREIAAVLSEMGYKMNHSSARNYVLRIMRRFADEIVNEWDMSISDEDLLKIVKIPQFQQAICEILQLIEAESETKNLRNRK